MNIHDRNIAFTDVSALIYPSKKLVLNRSAGFLYRTLYHHHARGKYGNNHPGFSERKNIKHLLKTIRHKCLNFNRNK